MKHCPECGKEMVEQSDWPGVWVCVDYVKPLNSHPPFEFKCTGLLVSKEASKDFDEEVRKIIARNN